VGTPRGDVLLDRRSIVEVLGGIGNCFLLSLLSGLHLFLVLSQMFYPLSSEYYGWSLRSWLPTSSRMSRRE
jgi:hypothetical protein